MDVTLPDESRPGGRASSAAGGLACTVRGCGRALVREAGRLACSGGHAFDVARSGYVNLLQPHDRRSLAAGDSKEALAARARLEELGLEAGLVERVVELAREHGVRAGARALDVGCGTGRVAAELARALGCEAYGVDLSAAACEHAARRHPGVLYLVANADRRLPFADASLALACSLRGPKSAAELARVLASGALLLVAIPAPDDLVELRAAVGGEARLVEREASARASLGPDFEPVGREEVRVSVRLGREALEDLLLATYRGARRAERARLEQVGALEVTVASVLLAFRRA